MRLSHQKVKGPSSSSTKLNNSLLQSSAQRGVNWPNLFDLDPVPSSTISNPSPVSMHCMWMMILLLFAVNDGSQLLILRVIVHFDEHTTDLCYLTDAPVMLHRLTRWPLIHSITHSLDEPHEIPRLLFKIQKENPSVDTMIHLSIISIPVSDKFKSWS